MLYNIFCKYYKNIIITKLCLYYYYKKYLQYFLPYIDMDKPATGVHVFHHPETSSHLPPHPIPLGCPRAPALSSLLHHWTCMSHLFCIWQYICFNAILSHPLFYSFFLKNFFKDFVFWIGTVLTSLLNFLQYCFCFTMCFFGCEICGILAPQPGIEPVPPALEGRFLTTRPPWKSFYFRWYHFHWSGFKLADLSSVISILMLNPFDNTLISDIACSRLYLIFFIVFTFLLRCPNIHTLWEYFPLHPWA